jgi:hypothetical protein
MSLPLTSGVHDKVYLSRETADSDEFLWHIMDCAAHIWNSPVGKQKLTCSVVKKRINWCRDNADHFSQQLS